MINKGRDHPPVYTSVGLYYGLLVGQKKSNLKTSLWALGNCDDHFSLFIYLSLFFFFTFYRLNDSLIIVGCSLCRMCAVKSTSFVFRQRITLSNLMRRSKKQTYLVIIFFFFVSLFGSIEEVVQILTLGRPFTRQKSQKIN